MVWSPNDMSNTEKTGIEDGRVLIAIRKQRIPMWLSESGETVVREKTREAVGSGQDCGWAVPVYKLCQVLTILGVAGMY